MREAGCYLGAVPRWILALLLLASCGRRPESITPTLPPTPAPAPASAPLRPEWSFDPRTFLAAEHLRQAGFDRDVSAELRETAPRAATWVLARPKGPPGRRHVEVCDSADAAARALAAIVRESQARPSAARVHRSRSSPDFLLATEEDFVPEGAFIRTLDLARARDRLLLHLRLEEAGARTDGAALAAEMEKRAAALLDQLGR
jgi:hypothetical protein